MTFWNVFKWATTIVLLIILIIAYVSGPESKTGSSPAPSNNSRFFN